MKDARLRLKSARENAGFKTATDAARRFGWEPPTYLSHENGSRGITADVASDYGRAFNVSPVWLLFGESRTIHAKMEAPETPGFADDAEPFLPASGPGPDVVKALYSAKARNPAITHRALVAMPEFAIAPGDLLVCDLSRAPEAGEIAIVTQRDEETATVALFIRAVLPPHLWPGKSGPTRLDARDIFARHPIIGVIRGN